MIVRAVRMQQEMTKGTPKQDIPIYLKRSQFNTLADAWRLKGSPLDDYKIVSDRLGVEIKII